MTILNTHNASTEHPIDFSLSVSSLFSHLLLFVPLFLEGVPLAQPALNLNPSPLFDYPSTEFGRTQPICIETAQKKSKVSVSDSI